LIAHLNPLALAETRSNLVERPATAATEGDALATQALVFVDLETSGANLANDRIIEIGLVEVDADGAREWSVLVNPETPLSAFISGLTGIDDAMLRPAATFRELAPALLERLRGRLFIAHNARFDYGFLRGEFKRLGTEFRAPTLCTVKLSRRLFPEHHRHNLDTLLSRHGVTVTGDRHRALTDARALWDLWQCWHRLLPAATIRDAVRTLVGRPALPPQLDAASIDELPEAAGAYALYGENDRLLLIKRCANLRQQVLAHFAVEQRDRPIFRDTRRVDWRETAGELGARLSEIALARAATNRPETFDDWCSWQLRPQADGESRPRLMLAGDLDFALADDLFGLYPNRRDALRSLRKLAEANRLCPSQLGLDPPSQDGPCAAYRQKNCRGACIGKETPALHGVRLLTVLAKFKLMVWPYKGAVVLSESDDFGMRTDLHLIDRWRHLGTWHGEDALLEALRTGDHPSSGGRFDPDIYHVLRRYLRTPGKIRIRPLSATTT